MSCGREQHSKVNQSSKLRGIVDGASTMASAYCIYQTLRPNSRASYREFLRLDRKVVLRWCIDHLSELEQQGERSQTCLNLAQRNLKSATTDTFEFQLPEAGSLWQLDNLLERLDEDFQQNTTSTRLEYSYSELIKNIDKLGTADIETNTHQEQTASPLSLEPTSLSNSSLTVDEPYQPSSIRVKLLFGLAGKASEVVDKVVEGIVSSLLRHFTG